MATNLVYQKPETAIVFTESGGDAVFTPKNCANGAGRVSAQFDRGSGAKAMRYRWEASIKAQAAVGIGNPVRIYIATAHAVAGAVDSALGQSDAALSVETLLNNAFLLDSVISSSNTVGPFYASGMIVVYARYLSVAFWNASGQALTNVNGDNYFKLIPMPDDIQAAA